MISFNVFVLDFIFALFYLVQVHDELVQSRYPVPYRVYKQGSTRHVLILHVDPARTLLNGMYAQRWLVLIWSYRNHNYQSTIITTSPDRIQVLGYLVCWSSLLVLVLGGCCWVVHFGARVTVHFRRPCSVVVRWSCTMIYFDGTVWLSCSVIQFGGLVRRSCSAVLFGTSAGNSLIMWLQHNIHVLDIGGAVLYSCSVVRLGELVRWSCLAVLFVYSTGHLLIWGICHY